MIRIHFKILTIEKMLYKISAVLFLLSIYVYPQKIVEAYQPPEGYLRIGPEPERMIPMVEKGFTLILPEGEVNGVVVVPCSKRIDVKENINKKGSLEDEAIKKNFAVVVFLQEIRWTFILITM